MATIERDIEEDVRRTAGRQSEDVEGQVVVKDGILDPEGHAVEEAREHKPGTRRSEADQEGDEGGQCQGDPADAS